MTLFVKSSQEMKARIIKAANQNPTFRHRLLDDPKGALADVLGVSLPAAVTITVLEEQPGQHYLVLPPAPPNLDALPLADLELALVGGGRTLRPGSASPGGGVNPRRRDLPSTSARQSAC